MRVAEKPYYLWRPDILAKRLLGPPSAGVVTLAWGTRLRISDDAIGDGLRRTRVYELAVTELIWRLVDRDELCLDVGANIGYFSAVMAHRGGRVVALEPHPQLRRKLADNAASWSARHQTEIDPRAASDHAGVAALSVPRGFAGNEGVATLEATDLDGATQVEVQTVTLDALVGTDGRVGVAKLDIEGHELSALRGATSLLESSRIRDIVFEELGPMPSPVASMLGDHGYQVFGVDVDLRGPRLINGASAGSFHAPNYLATKDPERAQARLRPRGWRCLRPRATAR